jgi:hypothetical protein
MNDVMIRVHQTGQYTYVYTTISKSGHKTDWKYLLSSLMDLYCGIVNCNWMN